MNTELSFPETYVAPVAYVIEVKPESRVLIDSLGESEEV